MRAAYAAVMTAAMIMAGTAPIGAQTSAEMAPKMPSDDNGRYQLQRTENGFFRVDRETGKTSLCRAHDGAWTCHVVADDVIAFNEEIERLNRRIATLEHERDALAADIAALKGDDSGAAAPKDGSRNGLKNGLKRVPEDRLNPREKDNIDQAMDQFEYMLRRFMNIVEGLTNDFKQAL